MNSVFVGKMDTCYICGHTQINCSCSSDFSISANESSEDESSEWESDVKKCSNSDIESDSDLTEGRFSCKLYLFSLVSCFFYD